MLKELYKKSRLRKKRSTGNEERFRFVYFASREVAKCIAAWKDRSMICTFFPFSTIHSSLVLDSN